MVALPIALGTYRRLDAYMPPLTLRNRYRESNPANPKEQYSLIVRPGTVYEVSPGSGAVKALFSQIGVYSGDLFIITEADDVVYRYNGSSATALTGDTVTGSRPEMAVATGAGYSHLFICDGVELFVSTNGTTISAIATPGGVGIQSICNVGGYILCSVVSSSLIYWIEPGATTITSTNVFNANEEQGAVIKLINSGGRAVVLKEKSTEFWYLTGTSSIFERVTGSGIAMGATYYSAVRIDSQTYMYVGHDNQVYVAAGNGVQPVSTPPVTEAIRKAATALSAWSFSLDGHVFYVLTIGDGGGPYQGTWVFDLTEKQWYQWGTGSSAIWNATIGTTWGVRPVAGDLYFSNNVWLVKPVAIDATQGGGSANIQTTFSGYAGVRDRDAKPVGMLRLFGSVGNQQQSSASVSMRFSDDGGNTYSSTYSLPLTASAYSQELRWGSLGTILPPGRLFEFTDNGGLYRVDGADVEVPG